MQENAAVNSIAYKGLRKKCAIDKHPSPRRGTGLAVKFMHGWPPTIMKGLGSYE